MKRYKPTTKTRKNMKVFWLFVISLIFVAIAAAMAVVGCNYVGNRTFKESFYSVSSLKVNNKIRVLQISDLHGCSFGDGNDQIVRRVEKLQPDVIVYTGDCVDSQAASADDVVALCAALSKVAPSYYIYGNNEVERCYDMVLTQDALDEAFGFDDNNRDAQKLLELDDPLAAQLEEAGVKVLKNNMDTITVGTTKVDVYGVLTSNPSAFWSYAGNSFETYLYTNPTHVKITALHEPLVYEEYAPEFWGDLSLAGHTHGGIAKIPMIGPAYTHDGGVLPERSGHFVYGRYEVQGKPLIVSSGLDYSSLFRINNAPELVIVDINKF